MSPLFLVLPGGISIAVPPRLRCMTTYVLLEQEDWFEDDIRFLRHVAKPGMKIIDIGANFGVYSLSLAPIIGKTGQIFAIEPAAATADFLAQSIAKNHFDQITLIQAAISDHAGTGFLAHGFSPESSHLDAATTGTGESVPLMRLDDLLAQQGWPVIDFLKIDAEGHEPAVIHGASHFLGHQSPAIMLEIMGNDVVSMQAAEMLRDLGYRLYVLLPGLMMVAPFDQLEQEHYTVLNLYALKPETAAQWAAAGWLADAPDFSGADGGVRPAEWHRQQAHNPSLPPARRWGHIMESWLYHHDHGEMAHDPDWLYVAALIAHDLGQRTRAFGLLRCAHDLVDPNDSQRHQDILRLLDHLAAYTSLLMPDAAFDRTQRLLLAGDQSLDTLRRNLLVSILRRKELPVSWTTDPRLLDPTLCPNAAIWAGHYPVDILS